MWKIEIMAGNSRVELLREDRQSSVLADIRIAL